MKATNSSAAALSSHFTRSLIMGGKDTPAARAGRAAPGDRGSAADRPAATAGAPAARDPPTRSEDAGHRSDIDDPTRSRGVEKLVQQGFADDHPRRGESQHRRAGMDDERKALHQFQHQGAAEDH